MRILYIDNTEWKRVHYGRALRKRGHEVVSVPHPREALALLGKERFDIILSDTRLSRCMGDEFLADYRKAAPSVPVIGTSGANLGYRWRDAEGFIPKEDLGSGALERRLDEIAGRTQDA